MDDITASLFASFFFTVVLVFIELAYKSKSHAKFFFTVSCVFYLLIMAIGNTCTTLAASLTVDSAFGSISYPGYKWFWYSIVGVFGFEVIIQNINLTFIDKGVFTLNSWITKAQDSAVASIIKYSADSDLKEKQETANLLIAKVSAELHTHALQSFGKDDYDKLVVASANNQNVNVNLYIALALAEKDLKKARAIIQAKKN